IARQDNIAFQRTLTEVLKNPENKNRFGRYGEYIYKLISSLEQWTNTARIDQEDLQNHINESINLWKQLQQAN
ncbi:MAG: hypothetical protein AABY14_03385, partial [Nanoarchaeota archaeon]